MLFTVAIAWFYAQLLTSSGVYNNRPQKLRIDPAGEIFQTSSYVYLVIVFFPPLQNTEISPLTLMKTYLRLTFEYHNEQCKVTLMQLKAKFDHPFPQTQALDIIIMFNLNP